MRRALIYLERLEENKTWRRSRDEWVVSFSLRLLGCIVNGEASVKRNNFKEKLSLAFWSMGARGSVAGWGTVLQAGRSRVWVQMRWIFYDAGVNSASNRNEYQETSWGVKGGRRVRLTILPPSVWADYLEKMWEPRRLTTLWVFMTCYRASFTFTFLKHEYSLIII
jgi:hypothetical protein